MFATLLCVVLLDRIGRRYTLYWGSVGQGISMFLVGGMSRGGLNASAAGDTAAAAKWGAAAASFVFVYTAVFGATWLTVPWLLPAEIFPLEVRAKGNAWGVVVSHSLHHSIPPPLLHSLLFHMHLNFPLPTFHVSPSSKTPHEREKQHC